MPHVDDAQLIAAATKVACAAYSPYSTLRVGAAVVFADSAEIYTGCNVENASYGLTICAERAAICTAVGQNNRQLVKIAIAVVDEHGALQKSFMPCGACRQFMQEFGAPDTDIIVAGVGAFKLQQLLPQPF